VLSRCPTCDAKLAYAGSARVDDPHWPWRPLYACFEGHMWRREELTEQPTDIHAEQLSLFQTEAYDDRA
jgi:hypothetical protein